MSSDIRVLAFGVAGVLVLGYQIYVTSLVWRSELYSTSQKWMQTILIWVLVLIGAVLSHAVMCWTPKPRSPNPFPEQNEQTGGAATTGAPPTVD